MRAADRAQALAGRDAYGACAPRRGKCADVATVWRFPGQLARQSCYTFSVKRDLRSTSTKPRRNRAVPLASTEAWAAATTPPQYRFMAIATMAQTISGKGRRRKKGPWDPSLRSGLYAVLGVFPAQERRTIQDLKRSSSLPERTRVS